MGLTLLNNFDPTTDFFSSNPHLKIVFPKQSSKDLWSLFLLYHPKSKFMDLNFDDRLKLVKEYNPKFDLEKLSHLKDKVIELSTSKTERLLSSWQSKLEERDKFISDIPYNETTYKMLDQMMAETAPLWKSYEAILKRFNEEESQTFGDIQESLTEEGKI